MTDWNEQRLSIILACLKDFTKDCREDMHAPESAGIEHAKLTGTTLDNAGSPHEKELVLRKDDGDTFRVNLCDLIAIARKAKLAVPRTK
jgi:hypothetical protein